MSPSDEHTLEILRDEQKITERTPTLGTLLINKLSIPGNVVSFEGGEFFNYQNTLRGELILRELSKLLESKGLDKEKLYIWEVLKQLYQSTFVSIKELRHFEESSNKRKRLTSPLLGSSLAKDLFYLMSSESVKNREKFNKIKKNFKQLTQVDFDVVVREKEISITTKGRFGVMMPYNSSHNGFLPLTTQEEERKKIVNEAFVQVVKGDYPVPLDQSASGFYEILHLLTKLIGETGRTLLLDEPELHLHPSMQKRILDLLVRYGREEKNQILLITHSPYLISPEGIEKTWRFTSPDGKSTKVRNIGGALAIFEEIEKNKISVKLSTEVRSILFSKGVILVEGLSDKIVVEQIDKFLSLKDKGANLQENEWAVLDINGKKSLSIYIKLCRLIGLDNLAILDYDALMCKDSSITIGDKKIVTSAIFAALQNTDQLENPSSVSQILSNGKSVMIDKGKSKTIWYDNSILEELEKIALSKNIFVFSHDLEGIMRSPVGGKDSKPLKALEKVLEMVKDNTVPSEFYNMVDFFKKNS